MGSSKHHRKHAGQKGSSYSLVDELMASATTPLPPAVLERHLARMTAGLDEMAQAETPSIAAWTSLRDAVYLMESLIVEGEAPVTDELGQVVASSWRGCDGEPVEIADSQRLLQDAMHALAVAGQCALDGKAMRLSAHGLQAVRYILEDFQSVAEALPARTMVRCFRLAGARLRKQVHQRASVAPAAETHARKH